MKKSKGFTLVELMVVIVIIGILAALAIPRFMAATNKSKATEFKPVLKSIYTMQVSYKQEKDVWGTTASDIGFSAPPTVDDKPAGTSRFTYALQADVKGTGLLGSATPVNGDVLKDMDGKALATGTDLACADTMGILSVNTKGMASVTNLTINTSCK